MEFCRALLGADNSLAALAAGVSIMHHAVITQLHLSSQVTRQLAMLVVALVRSAKRIRSADITSKIEITNCGMSLCAHMQHNRRLKPKRSELLSSVRAICTIYYNCAIAPHPGGPIKEASGFPYRSSSFAELKWNCWLPHATCRKIPRQL